MLRIEMPRGDLRTVSFSVNQGETKYTDFDEIFFTVKESVNDRQFKFQKKLSDGSITLLSDNSFVFRIEPEDTNPLKYGTYAFDIELVKETSIKQTTVGELILTNEVTFAENE